MTLRYGLYLGGFLCAYGLLFRLLELPFDSPFGWVFYLALPVAAGVALYRRRKQAPLSFFRGLALASSITIVGGAIYGLYVFAYNTFIDASLIQAVTEAALADLPNRDLSAEAEAARLRFIEITGHPLVFGGIITLQMAIFGFITTLPLAALFRKK